MMTRRMRLRLKTALFDLGDQLYALAGAGTDQGIRHRWLATAGQQVSELGWRLRRPHDH
jgi:hypothetical protein